MPGIKPQSEPPHLERGSTVFLTGATGFIGTRLIRALLAAESRVAALVLPGETVPFPQSVQCFPGNVTDEATLTQAVQTFQPEIIVHLAAIGVTHPNLPLDEAFRVNVGGMIHVLNAARAAGCVRRIIATGSSYEYGARRCEESLDPFNAYSASKVAAWACARAAYNAWRAPIVWLRPFQVYGPGQRRTALVPAAIHAALSGNDFPMTGGEQQRDFIFVDDIVGGYLAAMNAPNIEGRALDLGTEELYSVRDVVTRIWRLADARGQMQAGALPYRPGEVPAIHADAARTRRLTGWRARVTLDAGLEQTIEIMRTIYDAPT